MLLEDMRHLKDTGCLCRVGCVWRIGCFFKDWMPVGQGMQLEYRMLV